MAEKVQLFLTLDFHLDETWNSPEGLLWACLQPHVKLSEAADGTPNYSNLLAWIDQSAESSQFDFAFVQPHERTKLYVPVSFPDDADLTFKLYAGGRVVKEVKNRRREAVEVTEAGRGLIEKYNRQPRRESERSIKEGLDNEEKRDAVQPLYAGPFAPGYNRSLRDARAGRTTGSAPDSAPALKPASADALAGMLRIAFWGGTRRIIPLDAVRRIAPEDVSLMRLGTQGIADVLVTNLHSLNGLLFVVGRRSEVGVLKTVDDLSVTLTNKNPVDDKPPPTVAEIRLDADRKASVKAYFSGLVTPAAPPKPEQPKPVPADQLVATWDESYNKRVYVHDNLSAFAYQKVTGGKWFKRRVEREQEQSFDGQQAGARSAHAPQGTTPKAKKLRRVVVHFREMEGVTAPALAELKWKAYDSFDARIAPYRKFTGDAGGLVPLQLTPMPKDADRFYQELKNLGGRLPAGTLITDAQGAPVLTSADLLNYYHFPWDGWAASAPGNVSDCGPDRPTILYLKAINSSVDVTVMIPRALGTPKDELTTVRVDDLFGLRWEYVPKPPEVGREKEAAPETSFNILELQTELGAAVGGVSPAERLIVGVAFQDDVNFEFAQSISNTEGLIEVKYPAVPTSLDPTTVDPIREYQSDLVNCNSLNVYETWGYRVSEDLNPWGQIYPVSRNEAEPKHYFFFRNRFYAQSPADYDLFRYEHPKRSPNDYEKSDRRPVGPFFHHLYGAVGVERKLEFKAEHTYGLELPLKVNKAASTATPTPFDFILTLPTDVNQQDKSVPPGAAAPVADVDDSQRYFVTARYVAPAAPGGSEKASLIFNTDWLRPENYGRAEMRSLHIAAYRAVAEMAYAREIKLTGRFRRFNFREALATCNESSIAAGLEPVELFEPREWDLSELVRRSDNWLKGVDLDKNSVSVDLTKAGSNPVWKNCNVIELQMVVKRQEVRNGKRLVPDENPASWHFVRSQPLVGARGQEVKPEQTVNEVYRKWAGRLKEKRAPVKPNLASPEERKKTQELERILGETEGQAGYWIMPGGLQGYFTGEVIPSVCPLAFLPVREHSSLPQNTTFNLLRGYFKALQALLDGDFKREGEWEIAKWRDHFGRLEIARDRLGALYDAIINRLLRPLPDHTSDVIDAEVKALIEALKAERPDSAQQQLREAIHGWLRQQLWAAPSLFSESKAFLFTRLKGTEQAATTPPDFFQLVSEKFIRVSKIEGEVIDRDRFSFREGLAELKDSPWFGFVEVLDDLRYDNEFQFEKFSLPSFEGVIEQIQSPAGASATGPAQGQPPEGGRFEVPVARDPGIKKRLLHLPTGQQDVEAQLNSNERVNVYLASRQPLITPSHLFTGRVEEFQEAGSIRSHEGRNLSLKDLRDGKVKVVTDPGVPINELVTLVGGTGSFKRRPGRDFFRLSAIFSIRGDEEESNWTNSFNNDTFLIEYVANPAPGAAGSGPLADPPASGKTMPAIFSELIKEPNPELLKNLDKKVLGEVCDASGCEVLDFVMEAIQPVTPADPGELAKKLLSLYISDFRLGVGECFKTAEDCVWMCLNTPETSPLKNAVEAYLFATPDAAGKCSETKRGHFILLVNVEVPVWYKSSLSLMQTRNVSRDKGFAKEFGQASSLQSAEHAAQPRYSVTVEADRIMDFKKRELTLAELVKDALIDQGFLEDEKYWRETDLSVSVYHEQRIYFPSQYVDTDGKIVNNKARDFSPDSFGPRQSTNPRKVLMFRKDEPKNVSLEFFPAPYTDFTVDFQWSNEKNMQFFKLAGVRLRVT